MKVQVCGDEPQVAVAAAGAAHPDETKFAVSHPEQGEQEGKILPLRTRVVGKDGKIAYAGGRGPFGFKPDELEASIKAELGKSKETGAKNSDK